MIEKQHTPDQQPRTLQLTQNAMFAAMIQRLSALVLKILNKEVETDETSHQKALESLMPQTLPKLVIVEKIPGPNLKTALKNNERQTSQRPLPPPSSRLTSKRRI